MCEAFKKFMYMAGGLVMGNYRFILFSILSIIFFFNNITNQFLAAQAAQRPTW